MDDTDSATGSEGDGQQKRPAAADHRKRPASSISIMVEGTDNTIDESGFISISQLSDSPAADHSRRSESVASTPRPESSYDAATDSNVEKFTDANSKKRWKCAFCHNEFAWNATKVLKHFVGVRGADIKICTKIDENSRMQYRQIFDARTELATVQKESISAHRETTERNNSVIALKYAASKGNGKGGRSKSIQLKVTDRDVDLESSLTVAIANFILCCGLPFSLANHPLFLEVLRLAKNASKHYVPPNRKLIAGNVMDLCYGALQTRQKENLLKEANIFGLSFYGDGATIHKLPLLNILASGIHEPVAVLDIVDATEHMVAGGKKDATYIAKLFEPYLEDFESTCPTSVDYLSFDGAGNVQLAGRVLQAKFPRIVVTHGAEHVISLYFQDCFSKLTILSAFHKMERKIYEILGGAHHTPYALFKNNSKLLYGKSIGLFRPAGTRMAGYAIALMRAFRLKDAIKATVVMPQFLAQKVCDVM